MTTPAQEAKEIKKKADDASKKLLQTQQKVLEKTPLFLLKIQACVACQHTH